jgi:membrane AbrB-like protein
VALVGILAAGTIAGLLAERFRVPGGLILGSMVGAAAFSVARDLHVTTPKWMQSVAFIIIGCAIGTLVTRDFLADFRSIAVPALLAGLLIIVAGIGIALLLRWMGIAPPSDALATSPGALSFMSAAALEQGRGAVEVTTFHVVRVILVMLSLPLLRLLLPDS